MQVFLMPQQSRAGQVAPKSLIQRTIRILAISFKFKLWADVT
jgi:hypothetical protein